MDENIVTAIIGFVAGVIGTLVAPWVNWGIEKRRIRQHNRKDAIANWRQVISRVAKEQEYTDAGELEFLLHQEPEYLNLKPRLSQKTQAMFDLNQVSPEEALEALHAEISVVERSWHLL